MPVFAWMNIALFKQSYDFGKFTNLLENITLYKGWFMIILIGIDTISNLT